MRLFFICAFTFILLVPALAQPLKRTSPESVGMSPTLAGCGTSWKDGIHKGLRLSPGLSYKGRDDRRNHLRYGIVQ